ncbi:MAG TPA: ribose-phosphate pyrophosphokinase [Marinilabiliales bacterium]|jgi:ribose-phosphate pyrophosphokinase|nr:MAG: ribose-phosphate pyrophosphokinase [Bacteroidetes bacterium GWA2_40_14]OFX61904.1 MAG: ribose-phosphate pyrophosphokinase [Bacteroidetes bacterium GWC2_40_13]OFX74051.1 MAG: ribose-phosphate pyrophosphokinase [Bacteroidetes bacterium GWD2_40_43]OFX93114.1 MAG: ribose-phosphate pyrophosphokinase [Bacteroidetes bacterium GWE2_40_63]OFY21484.1 MAG: ribose-phosphate pyrophosphokinase [Bacteroidetes bacterium GWF2_40_13]HAM98122.1 ribose-phosphate pyrophosphokinase [Marinilabiliales bacteri
MSLTAPIKIFSGSETKYLAEKIAESYGTNLGRTSKQRFSDGEFQPSYEETVRGSHVFIVQSTFQPTENLFELLLMIDAAKRASAYKIVAVIPYFGYARQDRKDKPRVSIGAKLVADLLEAAGVSRVMTMDLHADQIQGFFNIPVDHLYASSIFTPYLRALNLENLTIAAPDMGGSKRAYAYSTYLGTPVVISHKSRSKANEIGEMKVIGDVKDKNVVIVDDMIDTAGTITKAADIMMENGARSVRVMATHPILSGPAYERIQNSSITELIVTDTIPLKQACDKITVLSVADLFANTIKSVYNQRSISSNFIF